MLVGVVSFVIYQESARLGQIYLSFGRAKAKKLSASGANQGLAPGPWWGPLYSLTLHTCHTLPQNEPPSEILDPPLNISIIIVEGHFMQAVQDSRGETGR